MKNDKMTNTYAYDLDVAKEYQELILTEEEEDRVCQECDKRIPMFGPAEGDNNEFLRIAERIRYEIFNNGGGNDKTLECDYLREKMSSFPPEMIPHIKLLIQFLEDPSDDEYIYERAMALSCQLTRYVLTFLE